MAVKFTYKGKGYNFFKHGYKNIANDTTLSKTGMNGASYLAQECRRLIQFIIMNCIADVRDPYMGGVLTLSYMKSCYDVLHRAASPSSASAGVASASVASVASLSSALAGVASASVASVASPSSASAGVAQTYADANGLKLVERDNSGYKGVLEAYDTYVTNKTPLPEGNEAWERHCELFTEAVAATTEIEATISEGKLPANTLASDILAISRAMYNKSLGL